MADHHQTFERNEDQARAIAKLGDILETFRSLQAQNQPNSAGIAQYDDEIYSCFIQDTTNHLIVLVNDSTASPYTQDRNWTVDSSGTRADGDILQYGGEIYVSALANVKVYNTAGSLQRSWSTGATITAIDVDAANDEIYVATTSKIEVYDTSGSLQRSWTPGAAPQGVAVIGTEVFVSETVNDKIEVYNTAGTLQRSWSTGADAGDPARIAKVNGDYLWVGDKLQGFEIVDTNGVQFFTTSSGIATTQGGVRLGEDGQIWDFGSHASSPGYDGRTNARVLSVGHQCPLMGID